MHMDWQFRNIGANELRGNGQSTNGRISGTKKISGKIDATDGSEKEHVMQRTKLAWFLYYSYSDLYNMPD